MSASFSSDVKEESMDAAFPIFMIKPTKLHNKDRCLAL